MAERPAAEQIAEVVADIRAGRAQCPIANTSTGIAIARACLHRAQQPQPIVDCQAIWRAQLAADGIAPYDDWPSVVPPWEDSILGYVNTFGNVVLIQVRRMDHDGSTPADGTWRTENPIDWAGIRWISEATIWVGGHNGRGEPLPTSGPMHIIRHAIREDGAPEDINWIALTGEETLAIWEVAMTVFGAAMSFLNASNVSVATPVRPRPSRRRIARTGVEVQTIVVRPPGKRRAGGSGVRPIDDMETVLSPVRGHFSHYGEKYGRGLLFGKYEGKFWIPGHVRGAGNGDVSQQRNYQLKPTKTGGRDDAADSVTKPCPRSTPRSASTSD